MNARQTELDSTAIFIGRSIFKRLNSSHGSSLFSAIEQFAMNLSMRDESLKSQLFRFVDVLPSLQNSQQIIGHLREYVSAADGNAARILRKIPNWNCLGWAANAAVGRMARRFIAASDHPQALNAITRLRAQRLAFTLDLLGEAVVSESEAEQYQKRYLDLLDWLPPRVAQLPDDPLLDRDSHGPIPCANFSIKLSSLYSQFDPLDWDGTTCAVLARLRLILRAARNQHSFVNFDMEQFAFKDLTLHIFKTVMSEPEFHDWPDVGIAMQAYLRSTLGDLQELADWSRRRGIPVWVRLVKGAYWDFETVIAAQNGWDVPVFTHKSETDASFETCTEFLMEHHHLLRPAIASHNIRSLSAAIAAGRYFGVNPRDMEFQMLFGMAEPIPKAIVDLGFRLRIYSPMGQLLPGMAYLVRRLLENTSNESFLRAGLIEHLPEEQLLMNPKIKSAAISQPPPSSVEYSNEPPTDFSQAYWRNEMQWRVQSRLENSGIGKQFTLLQSPRPRRGAIPEIPLTINGQSVVSGNWLDSINPSHKNQIVGRCAAATQQHALDAVAAAKSAFEKWRDVSVEDRTQLLERVASILRRDRLLIAATEVVECGKPWREADSDVAEAIDFCMYYAWQIRKISSSNGVDLPGEQNRWIHEPRGVAVIIAPWNFPLAILCGMATAAVVAGNTIILKPAEQSGLTAAHLAAAFAEAKAPLGVVNFLPGVGEEIGQTLINHPDVALIAFTGSRAVGLSINQQAALTPPGQDHVKRVILEMGGKNAIIVDEDADLDEAVSGVVASAFGYSGQKCSACSRVIMLNSIHDSFLQRLIAATASLKIAPAEDPACRVGPVIDSTAFSRIQSAIDRGKLEAKLAYAGDVGTLADEGYFIAPHIFAEVSPDNALATEEIFGPVLAAMGAKDLNHALTLANQTSYALTGGVYSRSPAHIERCRHEFRVGNLYINRKITGALVGRQPFGGFKLSGAGTQAGGPEYLTHFMVPRCITENTLRHGFAPASGAAAIC